MITHGTPATLEARRTPATLDARPNLLKISKSASLKEVLRGFAEVRPSCESPQMHGQGKCLR
jgi:hypothetical protein